MDTYKQNIRILGAQRLRRISSRGFTRLLSLLPFVFFENSEFFAEGVVAEGTIHTLVGRCHSVSPEIFWRKTDVLENGQKFLQQK